MRTLWEEDWLIERLLVSCDLTEEFIYLYSWSDAILNSKAQITHFRWGRKLSLDRKFPDGADVGDTIGLIPRFFLPQRQPVLMQPPCIYSEKADQGVRTAGTWNNEGVLLIWPSAWECSTDHRWKGKKWKGKEKKIKRKNMLTHGQGENRSAEWIYLAHILYIRAFSNFES